MKKLTRADVLPLEAYEASRARHRRAAIARKARRRVELPPFLSVTFENRETAWYQIQEMLRVERTIQARAIQHEIDTYNELVPEPGALRATLMIELVDPARLKSDLERFVGLPQGRHLHLEIGARRVSAEFDDRQFEPDRVSAVQYVTFRLEPGEVAALRRRATPIALSCTHRANPARTPLPEAVRRELLADLRADAPRRARR